MLAKILFVSEMYFLGFSKYSGVISISSPQVMSLFLLPFLQENPGPDLSFTHISPGNLAQSCACLSFSVVWHWAHFWTKIFPFSTSPILKSLFCHAWHGDSPLVSLKKKFVLGMAWRIHVNYIFHILVTIFPSLFRLRGLLLNFSEFKIQV